MCTSGGAPVPVADGMAASPSQAAPMSARTPPCSRPPPRCSRTGRAPLAPRVAAPPLARAAASAHPHRQVQRGGLMERAGTTDPTPSALPQPFHLPSATASSAPCVAQAAPPHTPCRTCRTGGSDCSWVSGFGAQLQGRSGSEPEATLEWAGEAHRTTRGALPHRAPSTRCTAGCTADLVWIWCTVCGAGGYTYYHIWQARRSATRSSRLRPSPAPSGSTTPASPTWPSYARRRSRGKIT